MRLGREDDVIFCFGRDHAPGLSGMLGHQGTNPVPPDAARIVLESDDAVARIRVEWGPQQLHQVAGSLHPVDDQATLEEPVAGVLAVGLRDVEQLDVRRVAAHFLLKQSCVVVEVPIVEREAHAPVHALKGETSILDDGYRAHGVRLDAVFERLEGRGIRMLGHPVMHELQEPLSLLGIQPTIGFNPVSAGALDAPDRGQPARMADGHGVGGPRGGEAHSGADFQETRSVRPGAQRFLCDSVQQEAVLTETLGFEGLAQQPVENPYLAVAKRRGGFDVEARLRADVRDAL